MNFYSIRHLTRFRYAHPISESIMETRMHPRSDSTQHCLNFSLSVSPRCRVFSYRDHQGNTVQHFDIPGEHNQLVIVAESIVEEQPSPGVPSFLSPDAWPALDDLIESGDYWEMLLPSTFAGETRSCSFRNSTSASSNTSSTCPATPVSTHPSTRPSSAARAYARISRTP